jgi:hypothetical protein
MSWPMVYSGEGEPPTESPWGACGRVATLSAVAAFSKLVLNVLNTTTCTVRARAARCVCALARVTPLS